jgi:hypothetical protein
VVFEGEDLGGELVQVLEVVGGEQLAVDDREVDLDLVQPGGDGEVLTEVVKAAVPFPVEIDLSDFG